MVSLGVQAVELAVKHVGEPSHGMPVSSIIEREGPYQALFGKSFSDYGIIDYIEAIIYIDKIVILHLPIDA
jgi:hypothetical protein